MEQPLKFNDKRTAALADALLRISPVRRLSIAYSGGVDSRFLAYFADLNGFTVELLHVKGPHISPEETAEGAAWARSHRLNLRLITLNPLTIPEVSVNSRLRCYFCKQGLFSRLLQVAAYPLCDGTNHSDLGHYRPGLKALQELKIHSPLAEAGMSKEDIRELGTLLDLENPEQPSRPCILTRFPYEQKLLTEELELVSEAEMYIGEVLEKAGLHAVKYRLRKTAPNGFELHIQSEDLAQLSPELREALCHSAAAVSSKFQGMPVRGLVSLSGFFDRQPKK